MVNVSKCCRFKLVVLFWEFRGDSRVEGNTATVIVKASILNLSVPLHWQGKGIPKTIALSITIPSRSICDISIALHLFVQRQDHVWTNSICFLSGIASYTASVDEETNEEHFVPKNVRVTAS